MKVVKNINNNVSLCLDSQGREVIAFGKGVGFTKPPYEIPLEKIQRTFYDVNENYLNVIAQIPEEIISVSAEILDYANARLANQYSTNVILTLADHIQFAIKRQRENIMIKLPLFYEIQHLYPEEMEIGLYALKNIKANLHVDFPREEAASIALHLVDYGTKDVNTQNVNEKNIIEMCTEIVEKEMAITIDKTGFNYSRFVTHMHYLLDRTNKAKNISTDNKKMFLTLKKEYPKAYRCALKIKKELDVSLNDEELLYLILHINRLCAREDCYQ